MADDPHKKGNYEKELQAMLQDPENAKCADCGTKGPRWASYNLGVFLCIRCGGLHRKLGVHISKVRSITLDSWTRQQYESMAALGNVKANQIYNPKPDLFYVPAESDADMEQYIRDKYERKMFQTPESSRSKFRIGSTSQTSQQRTASSNNAASSGGPGLLAQYGREMSTLRDMGFVNPNLCVQALRKFDGNVERAVEWLLTQPGASQGPPVLAQPPVQMQQQSSVTRQPQHMPTQQQQQQQNLFQQQNSFGEFMSGAQPLQPIPPPQQQQQKPSVQNDLLDIFGSGGAGAPQQNVFGQPQSTMQPQMPFQTQSQPNAFGAPQASQAPFQPQQQAPPQAQGFGHDLAMVFSDDPADKIKNSKGAILSLYGAGLAPGVQNPMMGGMSGMGMGGGFQQPQSFQPAMGMGMGMPGGGGYSYSMQQPGFSGGFATGLPPQQQQQQLMQQHQQGMSMMYQQPNPNLMMTRPGPGGAFPGQQQPQFGQQAMGMGSMYGVQSGGGGGAVSSMQVPGGHQTMFQPRLVDSFGFPSQPQGQVPSQFPMQQGQSQGVQAQQMQQQQVGRFEQPMQQGGNNQQQPFF